MLFYTSYVHSYVTISWRLPNGFDDLLVLPLVFLAFSIASMKNDVVKSSHFEFIKTLPRALKVSPQVLQRYQLLPYSTYLCAMWNSHSIWDYYCQFEHLGPFHNYKRLNKWSPFLNENLYSHRVCYQKYASIYILEYGTNYGRVCGLLYIMYALVVNLHTWPVQLFIVYFIPIIYLNCQENKIPHSLCIFSKP